MRLYVVSAATVCAAILLAAARRAPTPSQAAAHPNVLFILIDDMGWKDLGIYGSDFYETPSIDRLASQGIRFSQFYTAGANCSPTRGSLMTGKSPARLHLTDIVDRDTATQQVRLREAASVLKLPLEEFTIGEAFQAGGYETGYIGKWHLGAESEFMPDKQGFSFVYAVNHAGIPSSHFAPYRLHPGQTGFPPGSDVPDLEADPPGTYLTDRLTTEAVKFIQRKRSKPFFLVLSHYAVHEPIEAKDDLTAKYTAKLGTRQMSSRAVPTAAGGAPGAAGIANPWQLQQDNPVYAAMVESVDIGVAQLMRTLDSLGLAKNTIVVFMSDNGGLSSLRGGPTSNAPLRAGKASLYEGGIRSPLIVRWPGVLAAGKSVEFPTISMDLYPTLLQLAGLPARATQTLDGVSVAPLMLAKGTVPARPLFWHFPHRANPSGAIRSGPFKLVEWYKDGHVELFDLAHDPGELHDISKERVGAADSLRTELRQWRKRVGANMPPGMQ